MHEFVSQWFGFDATAQLTIIVAILVFVAVGLLKYWPR